MHRITVNNRLSWHGLSPLAFSGHFWAINLNVFILNQKTSPLWNHCWVETSDVMDKIWRLSKAQQQNTRIMYYTTRGHRRYGISISSDQAQPEEPCFSKWFHVHSKTTCVNKPVWRRKDTPRNKTHTQSSWPYRGRWLFFSHRHFWRKVHKPAPLLCRRKGSQHKVYSFVSTAFPGHAGYPGRTRRQKLDVCYLGVKNVKCINSTSFMNYT